MMDDFAATMIAEGVEEPDDRDHYLEAWQHLIDTGLAFKLQGWFGRMATRLIEAGHCQPPKEETRP